MKKNIILAVAFALFLGGSLLAGEATSVKVNVASANVRSDPDASAAVIAKVTMGTILEVSDQAGAWYEVKVHDESGAEVTGYIHNTVVEVMAEEETETQANLRAARNEVLKARSAKRYGGGGFKLMGGLYLGNGNISGTLPATLKKTDRLGFMGGLGYESGGMLAWMIEALYSPGGAVVKPIDPLLTGSISIVADAITLPVMFKVRFLRGITPYILAGGEVGYILKASGILKDGDVVTDEEELTDEINRLIYGVAFGAGVELPIGGMNLLLEGRYRLGLSNLIKEADPGEYMRPTALTFMLGVKF